MGHENVQGTEFDRGTLVVAALAEKKLPLSLATRVVGQTAEEITADVAELAEAVEEMRAQKEDPVGAREWRQAKFLAERRGLPVPQLSEYLNRRRPTRVTSRKEAAPAAAGESPLPVFDPRDFT